MLKYDTMKLNELELCAELAANAFANYEYFSVYIPDEKRRLRFLRQIMRIEFRLNAQIAHIITAKEDEKIVAVAILGDQNYKKPSDGQYIRAGFLKCLLTDPRGVMDWNSMESKAAAPCHEQADSWYLSLLTVAPDREGCGIGSAMLREAIVPCVKTQGGRSLCLFTNSEANRVFYQKNGFELFHEQYFEYKGQRLGSWSYIKRIKAE